MIKIIRENYGWIGTVNELFKINQRELTTSLTEFLEDNDFDVEQSHIDSWEDTYQFLQDIFIPEMETYGELFLVFEYMLPLEKGRRPDVLLMVEDRVIILEFKQKDKVLLEDIEQAIGYREDLKRFHHITAKKDLQVEGFLVLTDTDEKQNSFLGVDILVRPNFLKSLQLKRQFQSRDEVKEWLHSPYQPLPTVTKATLDLFRYGHLPHIKSIEEGAINRTVNFIKKRIFLNETNSKRKEIIFVSGVPGAGKTLVALKTLYDYNSYQFLEFNNPLSAIYLSGNGPLVNVLQEQLQHTEFNGSVGKTFIKGVLAFKKEYLNTKKIPPFHCIFFDEAQRAWDTKKMGRYQVSEPEGLLQVGEKIFNSKGYVTIVCFIGDGQTIHIGEEKGLALWREAFIKYPGWAVHLPPTYEDQFGSIPKRVCGELFLDTSIRSNFINTSHWIEALLNKNITKASEELKLMQEKGYILRVSRDYDECKHFIEKKSKEYPDSMYGFLVSSRAKESEVRKYLNTPTYKSYMQDTDAGKWFLKESKTWSQGATEFVCQGLELDFPLVCFGGDYYIEQDEWIVEPEIYKNNHNKFENFPIIVENIYRILLTRARKGMVIYIPRDSNFDETFKMFVSMGAITI
ncbi:DNA/RNA helicase domain-containing protein [Litchfieldia salsa]|uniref:8-oxo-dGTP diphosphatase n=1 Tax=Litchfieldia salsa TaxID=930152 RepID=A0A1H0PMD9_9BACI|nr:DNA/RNA helicase domain-containing protein [Litchfieldia salsa]SDP06174.1 8-oxo-dGTP diphosphatase [Litchfieldia salsa]